MLTVYPDLLNPLDVLWEPPPMLGAPAIVVALEPNELIVHGVPGVDLADLDAVVGAVGAEKVSLPWPRREGFESSRTRWVRAGGTPEDMRTLARQIAQDPLVESVSPVYTSRHGGRDGAITPLSDILGVGVAPDAADDAAVLAGLAGLGLTPRFGDADVLFGRRELTLVIADDLDPAPDVFDLLPDVVDLLDGIGVTPDLALDWMSLQGFAALPSDPLLLEQWHLTRIRAPEAWDAGPPPTPQVRVAVLDGPFDLGHPDLQRPEATGQVSIATPIETLFHADKNVSGAGAPMGISPGEANNHGTATTGLLAATMNNTLGSAGVAAGCSVIPIRVDRDGFQPTDSAVARGIRWAVLNNARVISFSGYFSAPTRRLADAVGYAAANDVLICAAAGNVWLGAAGPGDPAPGPPEVGYPAADPRVIGVGASDQADRRKTAPTQGSVALDDGSGETWESCYQPPFEGLFDLTGVDVVAPGVLTWTTNDRGAHPFKGNQQGPGGKGTAGYYWQGFNYPQAGDAADLFLRCFGGTSAATPQVAGLAALLLARRPDLSRVQLRALIESTCIKVNVGRNAGRYQYTEERPNGWATAEVGYGRIDCLLAVQKAPLVPVSPMVAEKPSAPTSGSMTVCGFLGRSGVPGVWRLYTTIAFDAYIEIDEEGIHSVAVSSRGPGSELLVDLEAIRRSVGM